MKMKYCKFAVLALVVLCIAAAVYAGRLQESVREVTRQNTRLTETVRDLTEENAALRENEKRLTEENGQLSEQVKELTKQVEELKTGGFLSDLHESIEDAKDKLTDKETYEKALEGAKKLGDDLKDSLTGGDPGEN